LNGWIIVGAAAFLILGGLQVANLIVNLRIASAAATIKGEVDSTLEGVNEMTTKAQTLLPKLEQAVHTFEAKRESVRALVKAVVE